MWRTKYHGRSSQCLSCRLFSLRLREYHGRARMRRDITCYQVIANGPLQNRAAALTKVTLKKTNILGEYYLGPHLRTSAWRYNLIPSLGGYNNLVMWQQSPDPSHTIPTNWTSYIIVVWISMRAYPCHNADATIHVALIVSQLATSNPQRRPTTN